MLVASRVRLELLERWSGVVLPLCLPGSNLLIGEDLAMLVLDTIHGQRVGLPLSPQGAADLHAVLGEALRLLQARDRGPIQ